MAHNHDVELGIATGPNQQESVSTYDDIVRFGNSLEPPIDRPANYWRHLINATSKFYYLGLKHASVDRGRFIIDTESTRSQAAAEEEMSKLQRLRELSVDVYEFPAAKIFDGGHSWQGEHELYISYFHTVRKSPVQLFRRTPGGMALTALMADRGRSDVPQAKKEEEIRSYELIDAGLADVYSSAGSLKVIARPATAKFFEAYLDRA